MSYSSLWTIDKNFIGSEQAEFKNSWCFSPIAWDIILNKYIPQGGNKRNFLTESMFNKSLFKELNDKVNNSSTQEDRILWELSSQQIFSSKDKNFIADCINKFLDINENYTNDLGEHIFDRFKEVANEIHNIDENEYPYFIFKNSSCDNEVERWFEKYNEEIDEYEECSLLDFKDDVAELVIIVDNKVSGFITNSKLANQIKR
jgi:hypothetical protein